MAFQRQPRAYDPAATRQALLDAGTAVFSERGFEGARVEAIARAAGVNKAMINYHFAGKAGLYREVLADGFGDFRRRLEPVRTSKEPPPQRLRRFAGEMAAVAAGRPAFFAMVVREMLSSGSPMHHEIVKHVAPIVEIDRDIIAEGVAEGLFRPVNPVLAHMSFLGSLLLVLATRSFRDHIKEDMRPVVGDVPATEAFVNDHCELFVRGLLAARGDRRTS